MLETLIESLGLLVLSALMAFTACAPWALRKGSREIALLVLVSMSGLCLLPYLLVPAIGYVTGTAVALPLSLMAAGHASGIAAAARARQVTGRPTVAA